MSSESKTTAKKPLLHSSIVLRVAASIVFIPCFIIITRRGGYHFLALVDIIIFIGLWEFYGMMEAKGIRPFKTVGVIAGLVVSWYVYFQGGFYASLFLTLVLIAIMVLELFRRDGELAVFHISTTLFGIFYVAWLVATSSS